MPKIQYESKRPRKATLDQIQTANEIIEEYQEMGFELTLRQLYYQFVARGLVENTERSYKNLGNAINTGRLTGLIDWDAITDRTRFLRGVNTWEDPREKIEQASREFRIDMWENQERRVEVWIEKDALVGVIEKTCNKYQVDFFSCRGYTSQSSQWEAAMRLRRYEHNGQSPVVIHLGDHDPSGIDMSRDINDRFNLFTEHGDFHLKRIALNMPQVEQYNPPPNPTKLTDSRAGGYVSKFGSHSWELDAIEPRELARLVDKHIKMYIDQDLWRVKKAEFKEHKETFDSIIENLD